MTISGRIPEFRITPNTRISRRRYRQLACTWKLVPSGHPACAARDRLAACPYVPWRHGLARAGVSSLAVMQLVEPVCEPSLVPRPCATACERNRFPCESICPRSQAVLTWGSCHHGSGQSSQPQHCFRAWCAPENIRPHSPASSGTRCFPGTFSSRGTRAREYRLRMVGMDPQNKRLKENLWRGMTYGSFSPSLRNRDVRRFPSNGAAEKPPCRESRDFLRVAAAQRA